MGVGKAKGYIIEISNDFLYITTEIGC
jgi:hypothetical protein